MAAEAALDSPKIWWSDPAAAETASGAAAVAAPLEALPEKLGRRSRGSAAAGAAPREVELNAINDRLVMIDTGAARSVCPPEHGAHAGIRPSSEQIQLVGASGDDITCHGERFVTHKKGWRSLGVDYKVADVRKPVLGVSQSVDKGTSWIFSPHGCYMIPRPIECQEADAVPLLRRNDLFYLQVDDFGGREDDAVIMPVHRDEPVVDAQVGNAEDLELADPACGVGPATASLDNRVGGDTIATAADAEVSERAAAAATEAAARQPRSKKIPREAATKARGKKKPRRAASGRKKPRRMTSGRQKPR